MKNEPAVLRLNIRLRLIAVMGGRLTSNDDHFIDAVTAEVIKIADEVFNTAFELGKEAVASAVSVNDEEGLPFVAPSDEFYRVPAVSVTKTGHCQGCGEEVDIEIAPNGHIRAGHDCGGDEAACIVRCPIQVLCGPIEVVPAKTYEDGLRWVLEECGRRLTALSPSLPTEYYKRQEILLMESNVRARLERKAKQ